MEIVLNETISKPTAETPALVVRLIAWYVGTLIGLWMLQIILMMVAGIETSSGTFVGTILAAMIPGDIYFRRTHQLPSKTFAWRMAIGFALSGMCVTVLQIGLSISAGNAQALKLASDLQFLILTLFLQLIIVVPLKWCFTWGASSRKRALEEKAVKVSPADDQKSSI